MAFFANSSFVRYFWCCVPVLNVQRIRIWFSRILGPVEVQPFQVSGREMYGEWCFLWQARQIYTGRSTSPIVELGRVRACPRMRLFQVVFWCLRQRHVVLCWIDAGLCHAKAYFYCSWISLSEIRPKFFTWSCDAKLKRWKQMTLNWENKKKKSGGYKQMGSGEQTCLITMRQILVNWLKATESGKREILTRRELRMTDELKY